MVPGVFKISKVTRALRKVLESLDLRFGASLWHLMLCTLRQQRVTRSARRHMLAVLLLACKLLRLVCFGCLLFRLWLPA